MARENEGGGDIDDEKDANADEETIEGLKRALASSQARARADVLDAALDAAER